MKRVQEYRIDRRWKAAAFAILLCIAMAACGSSAHKDSYMAQSNSIGAGYSSPSYEMSDEGYYETETMAPSETGSGSGEYLEAAEDYGKKLIHNYYLRVQTQEYDTLYQGILERIAEAGGYVESSNEDSYNNTRRSVSMTIRIPAEKAGEFLAYVGDAGHVMNKSESTEDLTLTYVDMDSRVKTYRDEIAHLEELAARAENISELLEIENMIANLRADIESYQSRLNHIDNKVNYSTIELQLSETQYYSYTAPSFFERIGEGLRGSLDDIGDMVVEFIVEAPVFIVGLIMFLIPALLIAFIIFLIVRAMIRGTKKRDAKKAKNSGKAEVKTTVDAESENSGKAE